MSEAPHGAEPSPADARHFRPSWPAFHKRMLARMLWLGPLLVLALLIAAWPSFGFALIGLGATMLLGGTGLAVYFARTRVTVAHGELRIRGPLRTRRWPLHAVGTLVFVPLPGAPHAGLYGVSPGIERMFALSAEAWEHAELEAIAEAIGAPVVRAPTGLTVAEITERYPATIGWAIRRPWLLMLTVAGALMLLMIVLAVISAAVLVATGQVPMPVPTPAPTPSG
ncbi:MAG TPA: hypothetical protein VKY66_04920 [Protaetiibacter sp.]|nr:hypothetical protein [Protaetiibacter sp.]